MHTLKSKCSLAFLSASEQSQHAIVRSKGAPECTWRGGDAA
jgi:hypothetical protein